MKTLITILFLASLTTACSSISVNLDNRVVCTAAKDKGFVVSQYGGIGVASQIAAADATVICASGVPGLPAVSVAPTTK